MLVNRKLTLAGSEKDTRHIELSLASSGYVYECGDSLGVLPTNCPELVAEILRALGAGGPAIVLRHILPNLWGPIIVSLTYQIPARLLDFMKGRVESPLAFLAWLNLFLLAAGCLLGMFPALIVVVPMVLPVAQAYGKIGRAHV